LKKQLIEHGGNTDITRFKILKGRDELPPHIRSKSLYYGHREDVSRESTPTVQSDVSRAHDDRTRAPPNVGSGSYLTPSNDKAFQNFSIPDINLPDQGDDLEPRVFRAGSIRSIRRGGSTTASIRDPTKDAASKRALLQSMHDHFAQYEQDQLSRNSSDSSMSSNAAPARPPRQRQATGNGQPANSHVAQPQFVPKQKSTHPFMQNQPSQFAQIPTRNQLHKQPTYVQVSSDESEDSPSGSSSTGGGRRSTLPNIYSAEFADANGSIPTLNNDEGVRNRGGAGSPVPELDMPSNSPQRTSSLYGTSGGGKGAGGKPVGPPRRKKSLPDEQTLPKATLVMSREEVSVLSHHRREAVRREQEEEERLRATHWYTGLGAAFKEWLSRQQFVMLVLFINISLAIMFFKLLT